MQNIINALDNFDEQSLKDVILYLKNMAIEQPSKLKELLDKNPSLVMALVTLFYRLSWLMVQGFLA